MTGLNRPATGATAHRLERCPTTILVWRQTIRCMLGGLTVPNEPRSFLSGKAQSLEPSAILLPPMQN